MIAMTTITKPSAGNLLHQPVSLHLCFNIDIPFTSKSTKFSTTVFKISMKLTMKIHSKIKHHSTADKPEKLV